jgi:hypothetical protein
MSKNDQRSGRIYQTTAGRVLGQSGCDAEGREHEWVVTEGGDRVVRTCILCGDKESFVRPDGPGALS